MPELPEVETVRRGLESTMVRARIDRVLLNRRDLRFPLPDNMRLRLEGSRICHVGRRAKYLLFSTDRGDVLVSHLGMSGSYRIESDRSELPGQFFHERGRRQSHDHVILELTTAENSPVRVIYNDPRRFGFMDLANADFITENKYLRQLGIEPTGNALSGPVLASLMSQKRAPLKAALLDQSLIAGLGNIYVCEALWQSRLSPRRQAHTIVRRDGATTQQCDTLAVAIKDVISEAIDAGGSSLRDYVHTDGSLGYFQHRFSAYDREGQACRHEDCHGRISRIVQSGRSTFFCPSCQR